MAAQHGAARDTGEDGQRGRSEEWEGEEGMTETSFMTFEGQQIQGAVKIMEKLTSLSFQKINRIITAVDSQPMFDGGVLINVLGRLQCDDDPPHAYSQVFVLKPLGNSFFCQHDIFRLGIHDTA
ncbi:Uncharacterized protein GBIM_09650 [Gryllus bimaculatus]|nr:Uncharacterized protein GBIM_09650 [Gryllus bimaculatus]